jgi:cytochrome P460
MIREITRQSGHRSLASQRLGLAALLASTGIASVLACSSDDGTDTETQALEPSNPVVIPERAPPAPPPPLAPGSDTLNGLSLPENMADWGVIGVVNIPDTNPANATVRVIVGNDTAVAAARSGKTNPWPDGSMFGHLQWVAGKNPSPAAASAVVPGDFKAATLMVKNAERYAADSGWAYGVWTSTELRPLNTPGFDRACVDCHSNSGNLPADKDSVFSIIGELPSEDVVASAEAAPNDVELPADILDWRVVSVSSREADSPPTIRVIVGNDVAVDAARSGETNPWPEGATLAQYVWTAGDNAVSPNTVNPTAFSAFTMITKDSTKYAADGGWAFGRWDGADLTPAADGFDRACVTCHTANVADKDFIFTVPGNLPEAFINP